MSESNQCKTKTNTGGMPTKSRGVGEVPSTPEYLRGGATVGSLQSPLAKQAAKKSLPAVVNPDGQANRP